MHVKHILAFWLPPAVVGGVPFPRVRIDLTGEHALIVVVQRVERRMKPANTRTEIDINRPPTGGDLTFSWKKGHI